MESTREVDISVLLKNLANSKSEDDVLSVLLEISLIIDSKKDLCRAQLSQLNLSQFLQQLTGLTGKAKTAGIRLLGKVFLILNPVEITSKYITSFIDALHADSNEDIKILYLKQLEFASMNAEGIEFLLQCLSNTLSSLPLLECVAKNIADESLGVAKLAANIILNVCTKSDSVSINEVLSQNSMGLFLGHLGRGSVVRFRVYDLFVKIFLLRHEILQNPHSVKVFESLMNEMNTDDILSQLNYLEMLSEIACSATDGLHFIENHGVFEKVDKIFKLTDFDPLQQLLIPGVVKFFGSIAIIKPVEIISNYQTFLQFVFANTDSQDDTLAVLCLETIANICTTSSGLRLLSNHQEELKRTMKTVGNYIQSSLEESLKIRILEALSLLLRSDSTVDAASRVRETLYRNLNERPLHLIMETAKKPFPAIRCAALSLLNNLAGYPWLEEDMALTAGFLEYLLDRKTEPEKEGKELKYSIIRSLSESPTGKANLGIEYYQRVCQYAKDGPFHSDQQTAVKFEEAR